MECRRFGNTHLTVSTIGLGCYGMSGAYGPADDAESIATIRRSPSGSNSALLSAW
jgi:aryl-alcohol dehydrogenase-like predicted oxidoreductase